MYGFIGVCRRGGAVCLISRDEQLEFGGREACDRLDAAPMLRGRREEEKAIDLGVRIEALATRRAFRLDRRVAPLPRPKNVTRQSRTLSDHRYWVAGACLAWFLWLA